MNSVKILSILVLLTLYQVAAKPYELNMWNNYEKEDRCTRSGDVDTTCQKCAKVTKSNVVFPMCCTDKDNVFRWCYEYINFGLQKRSMHQVLYAAKKHHLHAMYYKDAHSDIEKNGV